MSSPIFMCAFVPDLSSDNPLFHRFSDLQNLSVIELSDGRASITGFCLVDGIRYDVTYLGSVGGDKEPNGFGKLSLNIKEYSYLVEVVGEYEFNYGFEYGNGKWRVSANRNANLMVLSDGRVLTNHNGLGFAMGYGKSKSGKHSGIVYTYSGTHISSMPNDGAVFCGVARHLPLMPKGIRKKHSIFNGTTSVVFLDDDECREEKQLTNKLRQLTQWTFSEKKVCRSMYSRDSPEGRWLKDGIERVDVDGVESTRFFVNGIQATGLQEPRLDCCVCFEKMLEPTLLIPCGHTACKTCATKLDRCPTCRKHKQRNQDIYFSDNIQERKKIKIEK